MFPLAALVAVALAAPGGENDGDFCNILSSRHIRMALRHADIFIPWSLWTPCPEARCRSPPLHFDLSLPAPYRNGGYI